MLLKRMLLVFISLNYVFNVFAEEGITDKEIHIAQFGPLSGPAAAWGAVIKGSGILFNLVNEEGGICGRKIVYRQFDDSYNPSKTKFGVKQLQENVGIFAWVGGIGTSTSLAVMDYLMKRDVPWISPLSGVKEIIDPPKKYLFTTGYQLYSMEARILCKYAIKTMGKKNIAIVYQDDGFGRYALEGLLKEMDIHKMNLTARLPIELSDTKINTYAINLKNSGADAVLLFMTPYTALRLIKIAIEINYNPQWMGGNAFSDFPLFYKISRGMWKGMIAVTQADFTETELLKKYKKAFDKYAEPGETWSLNYHYGIGIIEPFVEALKRCGCDLTRKRLVKEMENLKVFKGILHQIIFEHFNPDDPKCRWSSRESALIQCVDGGGTKHLSDWIKVDDKKN